MRPRRDLAMLIVGSALATTAFGDQADFQEFLRSHKLQSIEVAWQLDRLRHGTASERSDAARALSTDAAILSSSPAMAGQERLEVLRMVVKQLPPGDRAATRPRLELARQELSRAAAMMDVLRSEPEDAQTSTKIQESLHQVSDILQPICTDDVSRRNRNDPLAGFRESADLLEAWRRTLEVWTNLHGPSALRNAQRNQLELLRAKALFARLIDADREAPVVDNVSLDLLRTESGAEAALGLAVTFQTLGLNAEAETWLQVIDREAPRTSAAQRAPLWRLAFAMDAKDMATMRRLMEAMPPRTLTSTLAMSAARIASRATGPDAEAVVAAALDTMDAELRSQWLGQLASAAGPLHDMAVAMRAIESHVPSWQHKADARQAQACAEALQTILQKQGKGVPPALRADALRWLGWAWRFSDNPTAASLAFEQAGTTRLALQPECLWLAAVSEPAADAPGAARRLRLLTQQRDADPAGPYAGRVATWISRLDGFPSDAMAIAVLMEVPVTDVFLADARAEAARRMMNVAGNDPAARAIAAKRVVRALEVVATDPAAARWRLIAATTEGAIDLEVAQQASHLVTEVDRTDPLVVGALARMFAMQGNVPAMRRVIEQSPPAARPYAQLTASFMLSTMNNRESLAAAVECAAAAATATQQETAFSEAAFDQLARSVLQISDLNATLEPLQAAEVSRLLQSRPAESILHQWAIAEAMRMEGQGSAAAERLSQLSGTLLQGSDPWVQTRWRFFQALQSFDAARAAAMLRQHLDLLPDGGAEPWGNRFRQAGQVPGGST